MLQRYKDLQDIIAILVSMNFLMGQADRIPRAQDSEFFSQPFFVAASHRTRGQVRQTRRYVRVSASGDGKHDDLPNKRSTWLERLEGD